MTEGGNQERTFVISVASKEAEKALVELTGNHQASFADSSQAREMFQKYGGGGESSSLPEAEPEDRSGGGEPPKPSDSKAGGNEDSDTRCIHSEDKPEPDAWHIDVNYHCRSSKDKLEDFVSNWEPPLKIESHPDLKAKIEAKGWDWDNADVAIGFSGQEPLYGVSTIRDTIEQEVTEDKMGFLPLNEHGFEKLRNRLKEVFGRRTLLL